jgi:hypothetical protein
LSYSAISSAAITAATYLYDLEVFEHAYGASGRNLRQSIDSLIARHQASRAFTR